MSAGSKRPERLREHAAEKEAAYRTAKAAYLAALDEATGLDGAFDPRTPQAQRAEGLRLPMIAARDAAAEARLAYIAWLLSPVNEPKPGGRDQ